MKKKKLTLIAAQRLFADITLQQTAYMQRTLKHAPIVYLPPVDIVSRQVKEDQYTQINSLEEFKLRQNAQLKLKPK